MANVTAEAVLAPVKALAGEKEYNSNNSTTINKYFNACGSAYCGFTIWYGFLKGGGKNIITTCSNPAYVPTLKSWGEKYCTVITDHTQAKAGDIFAYKNLHVGFVYSKYSGQQFITLEGNSTVYATIAEARASSCGSGSFEGIGYKKRSLSSDYTIYRPAYGDAETYTETENGYSDYIKKYQQWINGMSIKREVGTSVVLAVDGEWGKKTAEASVCAYQYLVNLAYGKSVLEVDGVFGTKCKTYGNKSKVILKYKAQGDLTMLCQYLLYCHAFNPGGDDGYFGSNMKTALGQFQTKAGLNVDYQVGGNTWKALTAL